MHYTHYSPSQGKFYTADAVESIIMTRTYYWRKALRCTKYKQHTLAARYLDRASTISIRLRFMQSN